eukprot:g4725.t1
MTELSMPQISDGLFRLGKSTLTNMPAYLSVDLSNKNLNEISSLEKFKHLQSVDLSSNLLSSSTSLQTLCKLPTLRSVDVSSNNFSSLDVLTEEEREVDTFPFEDLNMSKNNLSKLPEKSLRCKFLTTLNVSGNSIEFICGLDGLRFLRSLDVSSNLLTSTDGIGEGEATRLTTLNVSGNRLTTFGKTMRNLPLLVTLHAEDNNIWNLENLSDSTALRKLFLNRNRVFGVRQTEFLANLAFLEEVQFVGSPIANLVDYRCRVVNRLQSLLKLDNLEILSSERVDALNVYGADVDSRRSVHFENVPEVPFSSPFRIWDLDRSLPEALGERTVTIYVENNVENSEKPIKKYKIRRTKHAGVVNYSSNSVGAAFESQRQPKDFPIHRTNDRGIIDVRTQKLYEKSSNGEKEALRVTFQLFYEGESYAHDEQGTSKEEMVVRVTSMIDSDNEEVVLNTKDLVVTEEFFSLDILLRCVEVQLEVDEDGTYLIKLSLNNGVVESTVNDKEGSLEVGGGKIPSFVKFGGLVYTIEAAGKQYAIDEEDAENRFGMYVSKTEYGCEMERHYKMGEELLKRLQVKNGQLNL